jgi:hypothetical protein
MNKKILIVDDQEENLYLLQAILGSNGYTLAQARNGAEALELARKNKPDIIITDILMPVMDGFSLCRECKKDPVLKHVPLVFYTATYTDDRDKAFALSLGAARFIVKPEEPDVFIKAIRDVLKDGGHDGRVSEPPPEEHDYLKQYNETLIRKLEERSESLASANAKLKAQIEDMKGMEAEQQTQLEELRRWHKAMLGRECRNLELKTEVNELLAKMGLPKKYAISEDVL